PHAEGRARNDQVFRFLPVESVVCAPCARPRSRRGRSAVALAEEFFVRPIPARAALPARRRSEMAKEARTQCWVGELVGNDRGIERSWTYDHHRTRRQYCLRLSGRRDCDG